MNFALLLTTYLVILLALGLFANAYTCGYGPRSKDVSLSGFWAATCFSFAASISGLGFSIAAAILVGGATWLLLVPSIVLLIGSLLMVVVCYLSSESPPQYH